MRISIPKEVCMGECMVAATPQSVGKLGKLGYGVSVASGAGEAANFSDAQYREAGANILTEVEKVWGDAQLVLKVRPPQVHPTLQKHECTLMKPGTFFISFVWPAQNEDLVARFQDANITAFAIDQVPRISRAQKMDALSTMSNIAGYRAVVEAAQNFGRFFCGQSTAAGHIAPARVLVIGAGVAGLSAISTARGLGSVVYAFDTRPEVAQQINSLGAEFLTVQIEEEGGGKGGYAKVMSERFLEAEVALFKEQAPLTDIIITTALIPGKSAPRLIPEKVVVAMKPGSVIVDMAAEQGGNCEFTEPGKVVSKHGVSIIGYTDLPSRMAAQSSTLYANNLVHFLSDATPEKDGNFVVNLEEQVMRGMMVTHKGEKMWPPPKVAAPSPKHSSPSKISDGSYEQKVVVQDVKKTGRILKTFMAAVIGVLLLIGLGQVAPAAFMAHFTVFVLACFVGWQVIWSVTPALHTPLMSVTNAISGIIIIGGFVQMKSESIWVLALAVTAILVAMINIAGGFLVTQKMLRMFKKE